MLARRSCGQIPMRVREFGEPFAALVVRSLHAAPNVMPWAQISLPSALIREGSGTNGGAYSRLTG